jgi:hypothetical protein
LDVSESLSRRLGWQPELLGDISAFMHGFLTLWVDGGCYFLQSLTGLVAHIGGELSL